MLNGDGTLDGINTINAKFDTMYQGKKRWIQQIHAIQLGWDNFSGQHLTKDYHLD